MVAGVTGETVGIQRTIEKKETQITLIRFRGILNLPRLKGPLGISLPIQINLHNKGIPYDTLQQMTDALITACQ